MWSRFSLRYRMLLIVGLMVLITIGGGVFSIMYTYRLNAAIRSMIASGITAHRAAQELENALVMQKGYVTYFFQDGNEEWLERLAWNHRRFKDELKKARTTATTDEERDILNQIESDYIYYSAARDQVVDLYKAGERGKGFGLHKEIRKQFLNIYDLCRKYMEIHEQRIHQAKAMVHSEARFVQTLAVAAVPTAVVLAILLAYILLNQVLQPIRQLAMESLPSGDDDQVDDEVKTLSRRVHTLIEDAGRTQTQLQRSREHLLQAEKWAMVGKLAAGVAHSVRNPLTSVKMRLFSLERSLELTPTQHEDFEVVSEEIRNIDNIVQNFLEFSRPPKLKIQRVSPSDVVDMAIELLRHRLETYDVEITLRRQRRLPVILADPEQLKEVVVNLIVNACETMTDGGSIEIEEAEGRDKQLGSIVMIRLSDSGPGIPESMHEQVFQPFFSTKDEGTGLGLSIAARIVEEHGGRLDLHSKEGEGATFFIIIPKKEERGWARS